MRLQRIVAKEIVFLAEKGAELVVSLAKAIAVLRESDMGLQTSLSEANHRDCMNVDSQSCSCVEFHRRVLLL
jgi:hypothetical protein